MNRMKWQLLVCIVLLTGSYSFGQKDVVARTPPMGWNSWNKFWKWTDEKVVKEIADAMVSSGMKDAGYEYVVIDDLWQKGRMKGDSVVIAGRDENGELIPDPEKFPSGMKAIGDYIHSKGLKFGLYTGPGTRTCGGAPGSRGYEEVDVATFAGWGVDFIKLDKCSFSGDISQTMLLWRELLDKASRPIVLSVNMGQYNNQPEIFESSNMWRTTSDIKAIWSYPSNDFRIYPSVTDVIYQHDKIAVDQFPSSWNDPDMMQVGNGELTLDENKSHFNMWAIFGAPLMAGNDLRKMSPELISILTNEEVIEVNQDPMGYRGIKIKDDGNGHEIWVKKLYKYSDYALIFLNLSEIESTISFCREDIGLTGPFYVRDLDSHTDIGYQKDEMELSVPPHGSRILRITANEYPVTLKPAVLPNIFDGNLMIEAENVAFEACAYSHEKKGYSGKGYIEGEKHRWAKVRLVWKVISDKEKKCEIKVNYINTTGKDVVYSIYNSRIDLPVKNITLPQTASGKWGVATVKSVLVEGDNILMLRSQSSEGNQVCFDSITIISND